MPRILVTNDDGIHSDGLKALCDAMASIGETIVVAPDREMSAVSQSITLHTPLRYTSVNENKYVVEGTPADCVIVALRSILDTPPDLIVSGINKGPNLGDDISYSGTVAAALEGTFNAVPSIAFSLVSRGDFDFKPGAEFAAKLAGWVLEKGLPEDVLLNVNIPLNWNGSVEFTRQGKKRNKNVLLENRDPRGRKYFWLHEQHGSHAADGGSDFAAIEAGAISITPLHLNRTDFSSLEKMRSWQPALMEKTKSGKFHWLRRMASFKA